MADGIQRTPFDQFDLGGQLLQALVAGQQTKEAKERQKLQEKQLTLDERQQQLQALQLADPTQAGFAEQLSSIVGALVQPRVPIEERRYAEEQKFLASLSPEDRAGIERKRLTGSVLPSGEQADVERITGGLKPSFGQRQAFFTNLLEQIGSPALGAWNAAIGREMGIRLPSGTKTLGERQVETGVKLAEAQTEEAKARKQIAKTQFMEYMTGGFAKSSKDVTDEDFNQAMQEVFEVANDQRPFLSAKALASVTPIDALAKIAIASSKPPPGFEQDLAVIKALTDVANLGKRPSPDALKALQGRVDEFIKKYPMVVPREDEGGGDIPQGKTAAGKWLDNLIFGAETGQMTIGGRPVKPEIQTAIHDIVKGASVAGVAQTVSNVLSPLAEGPLNLLQQAYEAVLPSITTEPRKAPAIPKTMGALSSPAASSIPADTLTKLRALVAALRAAGETPENAEETEREILGIFTGQGTYKLGTPEQQMEYIRGIIEDIQELQATEK